MLKALPQHCFNYQNTAMLMMAAKNYWQLW
jgi:hypothetical protein